MREFVIQLGLLSLWGGAAALGALAVGALLRRLHTPSRWLCWLWLAVGLRFALPWGIPLALPRPQNEPLAQAADTVRILAGAPAAAPALPATAPAAVQAAAPWYAGLTVWHLLAAVWAAGVLVLAVRAVWAYRRLCRQVALACKTPDGCYSGACVPAPFTLGIVRPRIYLPAGLAGPMRAAVLLHERTHLRRGDPLIKPLFYAVACLHWFNPLAWLAFRQLEREMEAACDEAAVRGCDAAARNAYCETILRYALQGRLAPGSLAFGQGSAKTRIVHLLRYRRLGGLALALCALGVGVSVTACMVQPTVAEATPETAETTPALTELTPESAATPETAAVAFTPNTAGLPNLDDPAASPRFACPVDYTYSKKTFSPQRYEIWTMQSCWHNLPQFVGEGCVYDEHDGAQYAARDVQPLPGGLAMDLAPAYGDVPGLGYYRRTARLTGAGLTIEDETDWPGEVRLTLMSEQPPAVQGGAVRFGALGEVQPAGQLLGIETEAVPVADARLRTAWPDTLYRTVVRFTGQLQLTVR